MEAKVLIKEIENFEIQAIPRETYQEANTLSEYLLGVPPLQKVNFLEMGLGSTIDVPTTLTEEAVTWMTPM